MVPLDPTWQPADPAALPALVAARLNRQPDTLRVAIDGCPAADPGGFAEALLEPLRALGRPAAHVRAEHFWRDASLRLEYGREDVESYLTWLDAAALRREVLDPIVSSGTYLPSLRDPATNRATRAAAVEAEPGTVLLVSGPLLLNLYAAPDSRYAVEPLPFDATVHLTLSPAARARRTRESEQWTLEAFARYDEEREPIGAADIVIKLDDPRHPAAKIGAQSADLQTGRQKRSQL